MRREAIGRLCLGGAARGLSLDPRPATGCAYKQPLPPSRLDPGKKTVSWIIMKKKQWVGIGQEGPSVSGSRVQAAAAGERTVGRQRAGHHKQQVHRWMHSEPLRKYWLNVHPSAVHLQRHQCKKAWVHQRLLLLCVWRLKVDLRACWKSCRVFVVEETIIYRLKVKGWRKDSDACLFSPLGAETSRTRCSSRSIKSCGRSTFSSRSLAGGTWKRTARGVRLCPGAQLPLQEAVTEVQTHTGLPSKLHPEQVRNSRLPPRMGCLHSLSAEINLCTVNGSAKTNSANGFGFCLFFFFVSDEKPNRLGSS